MNNRVRLTEAEFHRLIDRCVNEALENEGVWNNLKTGANTFLNSKQGGLKNRWNNAVKNYHTQGVYDDMSDLIERLKKFVSERNVPLTTTVGDLIGGKGYKAFNHMGHMTGYANSQKSLLSRRGYKA